jgi:hypothetical protein
MPEDHAPKSVRTWSPNLSSLVLWLAFLGMLISLSRSVYQDQKLNLLERDLDLARQQSQKEISELRDAQSASLEQDLLRLDQLSTELAKTNEAVVDQATTLANRTKLELSRTVEQRHQEMIRAISDVRADLRSEPNIRASEPVHDGPKANQASARATSEAEPTNSAPVANSTTSTATVASGESRDDQSAAASPKKKRFWEKLNPFNKKKQDASVNGAN